MNKPLVDSDGAPARVKEIPVYSDHLPVELILSGATVNPEGNGGVHV